MNPEVDNTKKKKFNREWIVPIVCGVLFFLFCLGFYIHINTSDVKYKMCFNFSFIYFGCVPEVSQTGRYYEPNTLININDEFMVNNNKDVQLYVKVNGEKKYTLTFANEGEHKVDLYATYNGKESKIEKIIRIGDATPPVIKQDSIPRVKVGDVVDYSSYITITDAKDPNPSLISESIVAESAGTFEIYITAVDKNGNSSTVLFIYEVIA